MTSVLDMSEVINRALAEAMRERSNVTVLIAGRSGVGKSTLINEIFQGSLAATGQGRPVTAGTREITKRGVPLTLLDTRGLEMAGYAQAFDQLERLVRERAGERDAGRHVHAAWLCVQEDGRRVEEAESALCRVLARHVPVVAVVTKARADRGFRAEVQRLLPEARNVVRVRALAEELDDGHRLEPMGLVDLVQLTSGLIPEGQRRAFAAAQKADIEHKATLSHGIVVGAALSAATIAAAPIPFADAALIVPAQVAMLAGISATFGLDLDKAFLSVLVATFAGSGGATLLGPSIVGGLLKLAPGAGSVAGGAIAAATAGALTTAIGELYIGVLTLLFKRGDGEPPSTREVADEVRRAVATRLGR